MLLLIFLITCWTYVSPLLCTSVGVGHTVVNKTKVILLSTSFTLYISLYKERLFNWVSKIFIVCSKQQWLDGPLSYSKKAM